MSIWNSTGLSVTTVSGIAALWAIGASCDAVTIVVSGPHSALDVHLSGNITFNASHSSAAGGVSNVAPTL